MIDSNKRVKLFIGSCLALIVTSVSFAVRAKLEKVFNVDSGFISGEPGLSLEQLGEAFAPAFLGFTISMIIGGLLVDTLGTKNITIAAFVSHVIGITGTIFAKSIDALYWYTLVLGIGNGFVEAALNPLVASLYTENKTKMLNRFHVWFPGGIVLGSLAAFLMIDTMHMDWKLYVALMYIPLIGYGFLLLTESFPINKAIAEENLGEKFKAMLNPLYFLIAICMLLSAAAELGTGQKIESILGGVAENPILVLMLTSGIMAVGRLFAGPIVHRFSITGMLLFSAVTTLIGFQLLANLEGNLVFLGASVFAIGVTFLWPTTISFVAEKTPKTGAIGMSIIGGLGMLSVFIILPQMGKLQDEGATPQDVLNIMSYLPAVLILLYGILGVLTKANDKTQYN